MASAPPGSEPPQPVRADLIAHLRRLLASERRVWPSLRFGQDGFTGACGGMALAAALADWTKKFG